MKKILLISTGGTISSVKTDEGLLPAHLENKIFNSIKNLSDKIVFPPDCISPFNIDSTNIDCGNWQKLATTVYENIDNYDGFVITHGTDTMAYTSSALSIILMNINKPVIFTGSQISICENDTDAHKNIYDAFTVACSNIKGVFVVFNGKIICGECAKKIYTKNIDAFYSINREYAGYVYDGCVDINDKYVKNIENEFEFKIKLDKNIFFNKVTPIDNMNFINSVLDFGYNAILLECYGMGGVPNSYNSFIDGAIKRNIPVIISTQCIYDGTNLDTYNVGFMAQKRGVISSKNYTSEYALVRLMHFLAYNIDIKHY